MPSSVVTRKIPFRPSAMLMFCRILARVARARSIICASPVRRLWVSAASAVSSATSVPLPIAMPMVEAFIAGASFIPSPTIASGA
ncbi:Uncharacterised protein [Enterobacter cloacae]|nr:Uncharacterised protein [Enterobacter cloacae]